MAAVIAAVQERANAAAAAAHPTVAPLPVRHDAAMFAKAAAAAEGRGGADHAADAAADDDSDEDDGAPGLSAATLAALVSRHSAAGTGRNLSLSMGRCTSSARLHRRTSRWTAASWTP
jgi:hypothetical protein|eukprot:COSAG01_NODE_1168_length_11426_cov_339.595038_11_plen_118_part_00